MTLIQPGTWIVVADSEKALFLENEGEADHPDLNVIRKETQENPSDSVQGTDRAGRVQESAAAGSHAYQETDWHELAKDRFASDLADILYEYAHQNRFEHVIIVASNDVLGALRKELHSEVRSRVSAEIPKVLTNIPLDELEKRLPGDFADAG